MIQRKFQFCNICPKEELLGLFPLKGQTCGEAIANTVIGCMDKHHIPLDKTMSISTDGTKTNKFANHCPNRWPAFSPGLNTAQHVWHKLGRQISALQPRPTCASELRKALLVEESNLPQDQLDRAPGYASVSPRLNGYVNKQNCRIWSEANPQVYVETPLHPETLTVWYALWAGGIIGPYFFKNDGGHKVTVNGYRYGAMITNFFVPELYNHDVQELWFQQDGATCHTTRSTIDLLKDTFGDRLISRFGPVN
ncbi:putative transposable element [Trichonephila clavipes]|nr:putative transposable element [Trichonephila clavipes]